VTEQPSSSRELGTQSLEANNTQLHLDVAALNCTTTYLSLLPQLFYKSQKYSQAQHKMATFTSKPLFGGALIVDLPSTFADVRCVTPFPSTNVTLTHGIAQSVKSPTTKKSTLTRTASHLSSSTSQSALASPALARLSMARL
jgi:hypothetical protein